MFYSNVKLTGGSSLVGAILFVFSLWPTMGLTGEGGSFYRSSERHYSSSVRVTRISDYLTYGAYGAYVAYAGCSSCGDTLPLEETELMLDTALPDDIEVELIPGEAPRPTRQVDEQLTQLAASGCDATHAVTVAVYFKYNKFEIPSGLNGAGIKELDEALATHKVLTSCPLMVDGKTCPTGPLKYNQSLSWKRAWAVRDYIHRLVGPFSYEDVQGVAFGQATPGKGPDNRVATVTFFVREPVNPGRLPEEAAIR